MLFLKILRKIGKLIRGGAGGRELFLGAFLGCMLGMIPGFNLVSVLFILLILILNGTMSATILGFLVGKLVCHLLAPVNFHLGYFIIHGLGIEDFFRMTADTPVLALLNLHVYALTGGLITGAVLATAFGWSIRSLILSLRRAMIHAGSQGGRIHKLSEKKAVQIFLRVTFGAKKQDLEKTLSAVSPLFRKGGMIFALTILIIIIGLQVVFVDAAVKKGMVRALELATGAEVNIDGVKCSLFTGDFTCQGLQVTDPENPASNLFQAEQLSAELNVSALLSKRFVVDRLLADRVRTNTERETPGKVYRRPAEELPEPAPSEPGRPLSDYLRKAEELKKYLQRLRDYLDKREPREPRPEKDEVIARKDRVGYLGLAAKEVLTERPAWVIREIESNHVILTPKLPPCRVTIRNLSSDPGLHAAPVQFTVLPEGQEKPAFDSVLNFDDETTPHRISVYLLSLPLSSMKELIENLRIEEGVADVTADGMFTRDTISLPFYIQVRNLKAATESGGPFLGLPPEQAQRVLSELKQLPVQGSLDGKLLAPRLVLDYKALSSAIREQTGAVIKSAVQERVSEETEKLRKEAGGQIDEFKKKATEKLGDKLKLPFGKND